ncbi:major facilitator superfamily MFS_1 [Methanocaldococcus sp. FS406-22]|uniref:MFS transporter n=1 Tax=Methanocaldococcus sp. (strain FS406-22) TaxID=644281 RepID=UPI0001BF576F|nr:MFS transporter [Methanocaldococcus sp. FS406-22]ADC69414.1 major facilitator superfamily MFS_1 [Methanocaldococcus sp. FS406-22]
MGVFKDISIVWFVTFVTMLGVGLIAPIMAVYAQILGATNFEIGLIFSAFAIARTIVQIPIGGLSDIYGRKIFLVGGTLFYGLFTFLYNFVHSVFGLIIVRIFTGMFSACVTPVAGSYVSVVAPKERLGEYMGVFNSAITLGFGIGPLVGGAMADIYGIEMPFYFCGFLGILASLICYFKLEDIKVKSTHKKKTFSYDFFKDKKFLIAFVLNIVVLMINSGIIAYLSIYAYGYGISLGKIGFMLAATNLLSTLLQRRIGMLYDKFGVSVIPLGVTLMVLGLSFLSVSTTFLSILSSLILQAIGMAVVGVSLNSLAIKDVPIYRKGEAMGIFTTSINLGMLFGTIIFGILADLFGLAEMFRISALFCLITGIIGYLKIR